MSKIAVVLMRGRNEPLSPEQWNGLMHMDVPGHQVAIFDVSPESNEKYNHSVIDPRYFQSHTSHEALLLSREFWMMFSGADWVLKHEHDSLVLNGYSLSLFIDAAENEGWDIIGAPWPQLFQRMYGLIGLVGNGGLSLRRVSTMITHSHKGWMNPETLWENEDLVRARDSDFKQAPVELAEIFSWELNAPDYYKEQKGHLPFGCHGYQKHHPEFWEGILNDKTIVHGAG